jgi:hypothetical protein
MYPNYTFTNLLFVDLSFVYDINEKEKRNYHMWKYLIQIFGRFNSYEDRLFIFLFTLSCLISCPLDHSAYSNLKNYILKFDFKIIEKDEEILKQYIKSILYTFDNNAAYLIDIINYI